MKMNTATGVYSSDTCDSFDVIYGTSTTLLVSNTLSEATALTGNYFTSSSSVSASSSPSLSTNTL